MRNLSIFEPQIEKHYACKKTYNYLVYTPKKYIEINFEYKRVEVVKVSLDLTGKILILIEED